MLEATGGKISDALVSISLSSANIEKTDIYTTEILMNDEFIGQYKIQAVIRAENSFSGKAY